MTPHRWRSRRDAQPLLDFVGERTSARKLRLIAVACCRRVQGAIYHPRLHRTIEVAEQFADGSATRRRLAAWSERAMAVSWATQPSPLAAQAAYNAASADALEAAQMVVHVLGEFGARERRAQAAIVRDVIPDPFAPLPCLPAVLLAWEDGLLAKMAQAIYDERAFDRLPILADALEEAGGDGALVAHLREGGPHVRGCWVVDLLLDKN